MNIKFSFLLSLASLFAAVSASAQTDEGDPSLVGLFPIPDEIREILDRQCVFCHGEMIDGEAEIREDLDMSSDAAIRETLVDLETLLDQIEEDEMPQEAKLSFRLRRRPEMQDRLKKIKDDFDANGEKEKLLAWIQAAAE